MLKEHKYQNPGKALSICGIQYTLAAVMLTEVLYPTLKIKHFGRFLALNSTYWRTVIFKVEVHLFLEYIKSMQILSCLKSNIKCFCFVLYFEVFPYSYLLLDIYVFFNRIVLMEIPYNLFCNIFLFAYVSHEHFWADAKSK